MPNNDKSLLGIDYGLARIGLAVADNITNAAMPLATLKAHKGQPNWSEFSEILQTWAITDCIVGLPLDIDEKFQDITHMASNFASSIKQRYDLAVHLVDERFTTKAAKEMFRELSFQKQKKLGLDAVAAQLILQQWLNEQG